MQSLGGPAAEALRRSVRHALAPWFLDFLKRLTPALAGAATPADALAQSVVTDTRAWLRTFVQQVERQMIGSLATPAQRLGAAEEAEDSIALANIELRAEALYAQPIAELDAALERVRRRLYVPVHARALAPAGLCRALQDTAVLMRRPDAQRRILFERFDMLALSELAPMYRRLTAALLELPAANLPASPSSPLAAPMPAPVPVSAASAAAVAAPPLAESAVRPFATPALDDHTQAMLQAYAARPASTTYDDGTLAADLLALNRSEPIQGLAPERGWVPLQRIELAGQFLNEAISDPLVADELHGEHEAVRFPLVKSALTDATLFTAVTHPLRSLVNDLMLKAATSRVTGSAEARQMADVLRQVLVQFDLAPDFVREAMLGAQPIDDAQIQRFLDMQRQQARQRRDAVVIEAKRQVVRKLELATFGRALPTAALSFLNTVWGPLLVKRLLQHGAAHPRWSAALTLMEQVLDQLDGLEPGTAPSPVWHDLVRRLHAELTAAGMAAARVDAAMLELEAVWRVQRPV